MQEIMTAQDAAKVLKIPAQAVREHIKRKIPPFDLIGSMCKGKRSQYLVYTRRMLQTFGIPEEVAEERLRNEKTV